MTDRDPNDRERLGRDPGSGGEGIGRDSDRTEREPGRDPDRNLDRGRAEEDRQEYGRGQSDTGHGRVHEENPSAGRGWGIAALIVGILALLGSLFAFLNLVLAIPGLILGIVALRKGSRGFGIAAIILSLLAIVLGIALTILLGNAIMSPEFQQILQEAE